METSNKWGGSYIDYPDEIEKKNPKKQRLILSMMIINAFTALQKIALDYVEIMTHPQKI